MIVGCFISDRQDLYLPTCQRSVAENVHGRIAEWHVIDDRDHRLGLAGAVQAAWEWALSTDADYLFHVEEDFVFHTPIHLFEMVDVLERNPHLAQLVLKRQPWSPEEQAAGGIMEMHPHLYSEHVKWTEHERIFSLNPCLIPRRVLELGWPDSNEAGFTQTCIENGYRFAFFGGIKDAPVVLHVGAQRSYGWRL